MKNILKSIGIIIFPLIVGGVSGFLIRNNVYIYDVLIKPPFALPNYLFSVVWSILYLTMGIGLFLYLREKDKIGSNSDCIFYFLIQLFLNFCWSIVFFNFRAFLLAFILLVVLFIFVALTVSCFFYSRKSSGIILIPYLLFLIYAGYLNFAIWFLNM